ncbi:MAG: monofunctional biosynthetic peptidoglycan transglycosylase [Nitrospirota bacterium]
MSKRKSRKQKIIFLVVCLLVSPFLYSLFFPSVSSLKDEDPGKTAFMEYREKEWQREGKQYRIQQKWVPLSRVSPYLIKAVLIAEDDKFWSHEGFDYDAIQKAIEKDIKAKKFKLGGSTISQQLAKNLFLSPSKNPVRKLREAILTWRIESALTKKRILEIYLNIAEWGDRGIFGIEAASRHYYGKPASELSPEEAARLASVLPNPRKYNPLGDSRYVAHRSNLIYNIMVRRGIVVPEYDEMFEGSSARPDAQPGTEQDKEAVPLRESPERPQESSSPRENP